MRWYDTGVAVLVLGLSAVGVGCAHGKIPGTEIEDTKDTRAVLDVMEHYRSALEARDANGLVALLSSDFKDNGGSTTPDDDLDFQSAQAKLPQRFAKLTDVKVQMDIKKIEVEGDTASAVFYFNANYKLPQYTSKVQADSDLKQMWFRRQNGNWKIVTGI